MNVRLIVEGLPQLLRGLLLSQRAVPLRAGLRMRLTVEQIMAESRRLVPVDTGHLLGSAFVTQTGPMSYDFGYTADYALIVHEIPPGSGPSDPGARSSSGGLGGMRTAFHKPPTQYKFLEVPAQRHMANIEAGLAQDDLMGDLGWRMF